MATSRRMLARRGALRPLRVAPNPTDPLSACRDVAAPSPSTAPSPPPPQRAPWRGCGPGPPPGWAGIPGGTPPEAPPRGGGRPPLAPPVPTGGGQIAAEACLRLAPPRSPAGSCSAGWGGATPPGRRAL
eukprot:1180211-Prorocentrum_minimum.AAC.1